MNDYQWKLLLYCTTIIVAVLGCIGILLTAQYVNTSYHRQNSFNLYTDSCYVYGDNIEYAKLCVEYRKDHPINSTIVKV